jgi:hypothetical protein
MKAFITSVILLVAITAAAAFGLGMVPMSAKDVYTSNQNVRL